jgi:transcriptional regulator
MYLPDHFAERSADEVALVVRDNPLACIVAQTGQGLVANHIPTFLTPRDTLVGHIALKNDMHRLMPDGQPVLAVFRGDDAYVSPNRYPSKAEHHRHVPTWNYQVVHVHGRISFLHDAPAKRAAVALLTRDHERRANGDAAWKMTDAPADYIEQMLSAIVAFRIDIDRIDAKSKLSQNREEADHAGVIADFDARGHAALAGRMRRDRTE